MNQITNSCCAEVTSCCSDTTSVVDTLKESIETVSATLSIADMLGAWKVRWGIGRMEYTVEPGLYAVGKPDEDSPVLVSANYKLTFDMLRQNLSGLDCWLLILDTDGINVWCAAGKGTFGTEELVNRITQSGLAEIVSHRQLVLPQLGAPGINIHEIVKRTGFSVIFGPVRAKDIKAFIATGYRATEEMRLVQFSFWDRLVLVPMEFVPAMQSSLPVLGALLLSNQIAARPFDKIDVASYTGAAIAGSVLTPMFLPYIPGKAFSLKGWLLGLSWVVGFLAFCRRFSKGNLLHSAAQVLLFPAISAFFAMNFTGSSTYTSPSGVKKEMERAMPLIGVAAAIGSVMLLISHLFSGRNEK